MDSIIAASDPRFPPSLAQRLGDQAPRRLTLLGDPALLTQPGLGIVCGAGCPEPVKRQILTLAQEASAAGITAISGFQTPIEREWMKAALKMSAAIVVAAQSIDLPRLPPQWQDLIVAGRLLVIQPMDLPNITDGTLGQYVTVALLCRALLLATADTRDMPHRLGPLVRPWPLPLLTLAHPTCRPLVALGATAIHPDELMEWWQLRFGLGAEVSTWADAESAETEQEQPDHGPS